MDKIYVKNLKNLKYILNEHGVAIIPSLLDKDECKNFESGMFDYLEYIMQDFEKPFKRDDPNTYIEFYKLFPKHGMLMQHFSIGHAQFIWDLRCNKKIIKVFESIYNTDELLVSFDGASFSPPHEITKRGYYKNNDWLHCDQSFLRSDFECVQSWITAKDVNEGDATLTVLQGSNRYHSKFEETFNTKIKDDWYKLNEEQIQFYKDHGCKQIDIICPAGSLVLWDSRTIHAGKEAIKDRNIINIRIVAYLCYTTRVLCNKNIINKRIKAFEELRTTSHWPHKLKLFPKIPRTYGAKLPNIRNIKTPLLNSIGYKLIGYNIKIVEDENCTFCIVE
jgi:hypothetical protein